MRLTRRLSRIATLLLWIATVVLFAPAALIPAYAQEARTLYVGWQGGSREVLMKEKIFPQFAEKHHVRIEYVAGLSTELLARLQAQKGKQELDVVLLDDGPMYQAASFGLCAKIEPDGILDHMSDVTRMKGIQAQAVGIGMVALGIVYNAKTFEQKKWPAPTSWRDLENENFRGREVVMSISNTLGLGVLIAFAKLEGAGESDASPGFKRIVDRVKPNVLAWVPTSGQLSSLFQNGEVDIAAWSNDRANALAATGLPIRFVYPKEGAVATVVAACPVSKPEPNPLAQEFIRYLLSPEVQLILAEGAQLSPANIHVVLPDDLSKRLVFGTQDSSKLIEIDWKAVNSKRGEWTKRWIREVER